MEYVLNKDTTATLDFVNENGEPFTIDLRQELSISDATLFVDMEAQSAKYAWWASVLERAKQRQKSAEDTLDFVRATGSNKIRAASAKLSIAVVNDAVISTKEYQEALQNLRYWEGEVGMLTYVVKAFEQRERMLMQKSALYRRGIENDARN